VTTVLATMETILVYLVSIFNKMFE
jgi:hypothetical protein